MPLLGQMHVRLGQYTHDPLTVNAVVFDDGKERVGVVSIDVCVLPDELVQTLRQACAASVDIDAARYSYACAGRMETP